MLGRGIKTMHEWEGVLGCLDSYVGGYRRPLVRDVGILCFFLVAFVMEVP